MFKKILFFLLLFGTQAAQAAGIKHDFIVHIGPFDASRTSFEYDLDTEHYKAQSVVQTNGFFDVIYPFTAHYLTSGRIKPGGELQTEVYKYASQTRTNRRTKELIYNSDGVPVYRLSSKNDKSKKVEITHDPKNAGTTDLQTVFAEMAKQYNENRFCDSRMEVFDGKRRFAVIFKDEGDELLSADEYSPFGGKAHKCSLYIDKLDNTGDDLLWQISSDRPIYFWILEEPSSKLPFISRIHIDSTPLGELNVYAANITVRK